MSTIVYIDDEEMLLDSFALLFEDETTYPIKCFSSEQEAIEFIDQNDICCIFCDYRLNTITGNEVAEKITKDVPFYLLTGDLEVTAVGKVTEILRKPIDDQKVISILKSL